MDLKTEPIFSSCSWVRRSIHIATRSGLHFFGGVVSIILFCHFSFLQMPDEVFYALQFPKSAAPDPRIVLIGIDDPTFSQYGKFPWNREIWARFVRRLSQYGPKIIAIDVFFDTERELTGDQAFAQAASEAGNVVLIAGYHPSVPDKGLLRPYPLLAKSALAIGHASIYLPDMSRWGGVTTLKLSTSEEGRAYVPFVFEVASQYLDQPFIFKPTFEQFGRYYFGSTPLPQVAPVLVDCSGSTDRFPIYYLGNRDAFVNLSFREALEGTIDLGVVKGAIVLIGGIYASSSDNFPTPISLTSGEQVAGVVILANALYSILNDKLIYPLSVFYCGLLAALSSILWSRVTCRHRWTTVGRTLILVTLGSIMLAWLILKIWLVQVSIMPMLLGGFFGTAAMKGISLLRYLKQRISPDEAESRRVG